MPNSNIHMIILIILKWHTHNIFDQIYETFSTNIMYQNASLSKTTSKPPLEIIFIIWPNSLNSNIFVYSI